LRLQIEEGRTGRGPVHGENNRVDFVLRNLCGGMALPFSSSLNDDINGLEADFVFGGEDLDYYPQPNVLMDGSSWLNSGWRVPLIPGKQQLDVSFWFKYKEASLEEGGAYGFFKIYTDDTEGMDGGYAMSNGDPRIIWKTRIGGGETGGGSKNYWTMGDTWYHVRYLWEGTTLKVYRNGWLFYSSGNHRNLAGISGTQAYLHLAKKGTDYIMAVDHSIAEFYVKINGQLKAYYPVCEEAGNIVYDVSGHGNHLTGQVSFDSVDWERDENQQYSTHLGKYGFRKVGSVYIPAILNVGLAADGGALTHLPPTEFNNLED
jgi:hypothetical protein